MGLSSSGTAKAGLLCGLAALWKQNQTSASASVPPPPAPSQQASNIIMRVTTDQHLAKATSDVLVANFSRHNQELSFEEPTLWGSEVTQSPYTHIGWRIYLAGLVRAGDFYQQNLYVFKSISGNSFGAGVWAILDSFTGTVGKGYHNYDSGLIPLISIAQQPFVPGRDRVSAILNYDITDRVNPPYSEYDGYMEIYGGYSATTGYYITE